MKIYVASSFEQKEATKQAHELLERAGHEITLDWTTHKWLNGEDDDQKEVLYREYAVADVEGVMAADVFILLLGERKSAGAHIELGIALGAMKRIFLVGEIKDETLFYWHPRVEKVKETNSIVDILKDESSRT